MRRASSSKPLVVMALRLAASISPAMSCITASRTLKPSFTRDSSRVPRYISRMISLWRASTPGRARLRIAMLGTSMSPRKMSGSWSVKDMPRWSDIAPTRRLRNPDWKSRCAPRGCPSSMESCVSKWLRERSSVPAKGTNATCLRS